MDRHAIVVVATWLDEKLATHLRAWLRVPSDRGGPIAVSVGAHPESDVGPIHGASLRHVLIVADPERGSGALDIIDLFTPNGFSAGGDEGVRRMRSLGSQRFRAGSADVLAISLAPGESVDEGLARARRVGDVVEAGPSFVRADELLARQQRAVRCEVSVTLAGFAHQRFADCVTAVAGEIIDKESVRLRPTPAQLEGGFVIGRAERCNVRDENIFMSRVHAFIVGRGDGLLVADAGSTNGTSVISNGAIIELDRSRRAVIVGPSVRIRAGGTEIQVVRAFR